MSSAITDDRQVRAAHNQSLFREVNERIKSLNESFSTILSFVDFVCECANDACFERFKLSVAEYESLRQDGARFGVAPGDYHVWPDVEIVVERNERFWVVEKTGEGRRIARGSIRGSELGRARPKVRARLTQGSAFLTSTGRGALVSGSHSSETIRGVSSLAR